MFTHLHFAECGRPSGGNRPAPVRKGPGSRAESLKVTSKVTSFRTIRPWTGHRTPTFGYCDAVDRATRYDQWRRVLPRQGAQQQQRRRLLPRSRRGSRPVDRDDGGAARARRKGRCRGTPEPAGRPVRRGRQPRCWAVCRTTSRLRPHLLLTEGRLTPVGHSDRSTPGTESRTPTTGPSAPCSTSCRRRRASCDEEPGDTSCWRHMASSAPPSAIGPAGPGIPSSTLMSSFPTWSKVQMVGGRPPTAATCTPGRRPPAPSTNPPSGLSWHRSAFAGRSGATGSASSPTSQRTFCGHSPSEGPTSRRPWTSEA
jgi:hypothetical protein